MILYNLFVVKTEVSKNMLWQIRHFHSFKLDILMRHWATKSCVHNINDVNVSTTSFDSSTRPKLDALAMVSLYCS